MYPSIIILRYKLNFFIKKNYVKWNGTRIVLESAVESLGFTECQEFGRFVKQQGCTRL